MEETHWSLYKPTYPGFCWLCLQTQQQTYKNICNKSLEKFQTLNNLKIKKNKNKNEAHDTNGINSNSRNSCYYLRQNLFLSTVQNTITNFPVVLCRSNQKWQLCEKYLEWRWMTKARNFGYYISLSFTVYKLTICI